MIHSYPLKLLPFIAFSKQRGPDIICQLYSEFGLVYLNVLDFCQHLVTTKLKCKCVFRGLLSGIPSLLRLLVEMIRKTSFVLELKSQH